MTTNEVPRCHAARRSGGQCMHAAGMGHADDCTYGNPVKPLLSDLCEALGWQGGTIHDALREVARLRKAEAALTARLEYAVSMFHRDGIRPLRGEAFTDTDMDYITGRHEGELTTADYELLADLGALPLDNVH